MKFLISLILTGLITACGPHHEIKTSSPLSDDRSPLNVEQDLNFELIKSKVLEPYCISCHTGHHDAYSSHAVVKASLNQIVSRVTTRDSARKMPKPPLPDMNEESKQLLLSWIEAGAPEFEVRKPEPPPDSGPNPIDVRQIGFQDIKDNLLLKYRCTSCHSQFVDYEATRSSIGSIQSLVLNDKMPFPIRRGGKVIPVAQADKDLLIEWTSQGLPEFAGTPPPPAIPPELKPNYESLRNQVFGPKCTICHNSLGPRGPTAMETYAQLLLWYQHSPELFNLESPEDSHFIGSIRGRVDDDEFFFDRMPFNNEFDDIEYQVPEVTNQEIEVIKKWISLELPYNEDEIAF